MSELQPHDLMTVTDIAEWAGVSRLTARQWTHRYPDFPVPWKRGRVGEPHLYLRGDVSLWMAQTGRNRITESQQTVLD